MAYSYYGGNQYPYSQYYQQPVEYIKWVDGEVGAKAFQKPADLSPGASIPLWDSSAQKIYIKSWNQIGMANPLCEIDYTIKEPQLNITQGMSSSNGGVEYASKEDLQRLKEEILSAINERGGNGGSRNGKSSV